jgi:hypothetical protein
MNRILRNDFKIGARLAIQYRRRSELVLKFKIGAKNLLLGRSALNSCSKFVIGPRLAIQYRGRSKLVLKFKIGAENLL